MFPAGGAGGGAVAARAGRVLAGPAVPRAAAHVHDGHVRADQVRQHQAEDEQQARQPHVAHRVQQLHQAARRAAAAGGARAVAGQRPRRLLRGAARGGGARAPAAGQLRRPPVAPSRPPRGGVPRRPPLVISVRFSITFCILVRYVDV